MSRTVDLSVPRWVRILFVFFLLGGAFVTGTAALLDITVETLGLAENAYMSSLALSVFAYLVVCAVWFARTTDTDGGSVWSAIPDSQYTGQHAESGGIARKEQEDAIRELQESEE
ncbi:hypothetical protein I7X12_18200 [Halosimplex litoreum]|uniref:Uncharacterized protein n=1 Tax=Halosimplex litoreum TaxID=1198301 RepID=A0A7T3FXS4_9EURY|nr:hypothetical protein [Halosimplex litoreum]QPV62636.1 hypothetical protein I7X12_18200 [Halosimplex litoreum]